LKMLRLTEDYDYDERRHVQNMTIVVGNVLIDPLVAQMKMNQDLSGEIIMLKAYSERKKKYWLGGRAPSGEMCHLKPKKKRYPKCRRLATSKMEKKMKLSEKPVEKKKEKARRKEKTWVEKKTSLQGHIISLTNDNRCRINCKRSERKREEGEKEVGVGGSDRVKRKKKERRERKRGKCFFWWNVRGTIEGKR
jgi:hypothetical protein